MTFRLRSFLKRLFAGKPVVASRNVSCFLSLESVCLLCWRARNVLGQQKQYGNLVPREPLAVNSLFMGEISAKICCCEAFEVECGQPLSSTHKQRWRRFTTTRNYRNHEYFITFPRPFVQDCSFSTLCEQSLIGWGGEKEALPESRQTFEVAAARTSGLNNLVLCRQTSFFRVWASIYIWTNGHNRAGWSKRTTKGLG